LLLLHTYLWPFSAFLSTCSQESLIKEGIERNEIKNDIDVMSLASFLSSSMKEAIMASGL